MGMNQAETDARQLLDLSATLRQEDFAELVGVSQQSISRWVGKGVLEPNGSALEWLQAYTARLREESAGRDEDGDLARERAALARAQGRGQEIRNARELGQFAPRALLEDVLRLVSEAVAERMVDLPARVFEACPGLPDAARAVIERTAAAARAEWLRSTASLSEIDLDAIAGDGEEIDQPQSDAGDEPDFATSPQGRT